MLALGVHIYYVRYDKRMSQDTLHKVSKCVSHCIFGYDKLDVIVVIQAT
jgi:hypothetical protein